MGGSLGLLNNKQMNFIVSDPPMGLSPSLTTRLRELLFSGFWDPEDSKHQAQVESSQVECVATQIPRPYWTSLHAPNSASPIAWNAKHALSQPGPSDAQLFGGIMLGIRELSSSPENIEH